MTESIRNLCEKCGKPFYDTGESTAIQEICTCWKDSGITGWICPVCGAGLSPFTTICPCTQTTYLPIISYGTNKPTLDGG